MNLAYKRGQYKVYFYNNDEYIIHNSRRNFSTHHTHLRNFKTAKYLIYLSANKIIPKHLSDYLLESLIRISTDINYIQQIETKLKNQKKKFHR